MMGWKEYIDHQVAQGVFSDNAASVENDPRVIREFLSLLKNENPNEPDVEIDVLANRFGFYFDPADVGRDGANIASSSHLIDVNLNVPYAEFVKALPAIREQRSKPILTDTFSFSDGYGAGGEKHEGLIWLNSPVATLDQPFEPFIESLTSERRKKYRRSINDFEKTNLRFEMSDQGLSENEIDFIRINQKKKWGDEADYAFRQTLWAVAVQRIRPKQALVMRVMDGDKMAFVQTMIVKGEAVYCQSIAKDEENFFSGLAAYTDFECIKALCGKSGYAIFDPSCRCSLEDPESIGIAKRATVNKNCLKPLLAIGKLPDELQAIIDAGHIQGKEA